MVQRALRLRRPRRGLRDLGYIEGKNILVEFRSAEGKLDRIPGFVAELVQRNVDVLIATKFTSDPRRQGVHCVLLLDRAASGCPPHVCVRRTTLELAPL